MNTETTKSPQCYQKLLNKKRVLSSKERAMVLKVYSYFRNKEDCCVAQAAKKTHEATGVSYKLVLSFKNEYRSTGKLETPTKKKSPGTQKTRLDIYDSFHQEAIRRKIHGFFYRKNKLPTMKKIKAVMDEDQDMPNLSISTWNRLLHDMGFQFIKRGKNSLLIDRDDIVAWRHRYLRTIKQHRQNNRNIVYTDETWANAGITNSKSWVDTSIKSSSDARRKCLTTGNHMPSGKGGRVILVHAGTENGFVPGADLIYYGKKNGDYHDEMDGKMYQQYFTDKLLPNIPPNSVIVMDNASVHSVKSEKIPTKSCTKAVIQAWLTSKNVNWEESMNKMELMEIVDSIRGRYDKFVIEEIAKSAGHEILRLPPYHCELNPIEEVWSQVKRYVAQENSTFKIQDVQKLMAEGISKVTPEQWKNYTADIIKIEQQFWETDCLIDKIHDRVVINLEEDSDNSTSEEDEEEMDHGEDEDDLGVAPLPE